MTGGMGGVTGGMGGVIGGMGRCDRGVGRQIFSIDRNIRVVLYHRSPIDHHTSLSIDAMHSILTEPTNASKQRLLCMKE